MEIKQLSSDTIEDWYDFFDNRAFSDHKEWNTCYCTAFFTPRFVEYKSKSIKKRDYSRWLIENDKMKGFIAYENGKVVGWVNANDKIYFPRLKNIYEKDEKTFSIACFIVQKEYRRKGIAQRLLNTVIQYAEENGYHIIEAYPKKKTNSEYNIWNGPYEMYKRNSFIDHRINEVNVVRKYI